MSDTISVIVTPVDATKGVFDASSWAISNIPLEKLRSNLASLIAKLGAITAALDTADRKIVIKEFEVGIEITAEGGVSLIGTAKAGATASIKLTFAGRQ